MNAKEVLAKYLQNDNVESSYLNEKRNLYKVGNDYYFVGLAENKQDNIESLLQDKIEYYTKIGEIARHRLETEFPCTDKEKDYHYWISIYPESYLSSPKFALDDIDNQRKEEEDIYKKFLSDYIKDGEYIKFINNNTASDIFKDKGEYRAYCVKHIGTYGDNRSEYNLYDIADMVRVIRAYEDSKWSRDNLIKEVVESDMDDIQYNVNQHHQNQNTVYKYGAFYETIDKYDTETPNMYNVEEGSYKDFIKMPYISQLLRDGKVIIDFKALWKDAKEATDVILLFENVGKQYQTVTENNKEYYIYKLTDKDIQAMQFIDEERNKARQSIQLKIDFIPSEMETIKQTKSGHIFGDDIKELRKELSEKLQSKLSSDGFNIRGFELYSNKKVNDFLYSQTIKYNYKDEFDKSDDKFRLILNIDHLSGYFEDRSVGIDGEFEEAFNDEDEIKDYIQELLGEGVQFRIEKCEFTSFDEMKEQYWNKKSEPDYDYER